MLWDTGKNVLGLYTTQHGMLRGGSKVRERRGWGDFRGKNNRGEDRGAKG